MDKQKRYNIILKEDLIFKSIHENYKDNDDLLKKMNIVMAQESFQQDNVIWLYKKDSLRITHPFPK